MMKQRESLPGIFDTETPTLTKNHLYYGDNLTIMRSMPNACVDLIYLDPPFNSQRNYNLIYSKVTGQPVPEQEEAFCDAWDMDPEKEEMARRMPIVLREYGVDEDLVLFWKAWIDALRHTQPRLLAYLIYMSYRLLEMRRVLKSTGSLYLHCDPTASHYIKVIMDGVFGHHNFRNEIIWKRTTAHSDSKKAGRIHDVLLFYSKGDKYIWNRVFQPYDPNYVERYYRYKDDKGKYASGDVAAAGPGPARYFKGELREPPPGSHWRFTQEKIDQYVAEGRIFFTENGFPRHKRYLKDMPGVPMQDIWADNDVQPIVSWSDEGLGYPTQKPIKLLQRIISLSTNEGGLVFDPFCGCGTAIYAAHLLGRKWIGCDIAILSIQLVRDVLLKRYGLKDGEQYTISGIPLSIEGARDLFDRDPRQFQHWAVELAGGFSSTKHSGDEGIDGRIHFETKDGLKNMIISVKGGKLTPAFVRELAGTTRDRPGTEMGGFICLENPTKGMDQEVAKAGMYTYLGHDYPRLQIRTIQDLLDGKGFDTPSKVQTLGWQKQYAMPI